MFGSGLEQFFFNTPSVVTSEIRADLDLDSAAVTYRGYAMIPCFVA